MNNIAATRLTNFTKYLRKFGHEVDVITRHYTSEDLAGSNLSVAMNAGDDIDDLMLLAQADITSKNERKVKRYLSNYELLKVRITEVEETDRIRNWQPPISGDLIIETFNIKPSKNVGIIKNAIREAILDGVIPNEYEAAFSFMLKEGKKLGLVVNEA